MMGYLYRFTVPFWVPIVIAAGAALAKSAGQGDPNRWRRSLVALALYHALALIPALHQVRVVSPAANDVHLAFGRMLSKFPERGRLLALDDVGAAAYLSGWETDEGAGLVTPDVSLRHTSRADLVRSRKPDVILLAECRSERLDRALEDDYILIARLPWIVFTDGSLEVFQCVYCRASYPFRDLLADRVRALGHAPRAAPWYFAPYRGLKRILRL